MMQEEACISIALFFPLSLTLYSDMHDYHTHTHCSHCLLYLHNASEQSQSCRCANRWQVGDREGRELTYPHTHGQAATLKWRRDDRKKIHVHIVAYCIHTEWHVACIELAHTDMSLSDCTNGHRRADRLMCLCRGCYFCVHWSAEECVILDKPSDNAMFVSWSGVTGLHAISCHLTGLLACRLPWPHIQSRPLLVSHAGSWHWNFNKLPEQLNLTLMCPLPGTKLPAPAAMT